MKSAVTVSLVKEAKGGPFVFWDDLPAACAKAREIGFDAVEIFPPEPDAIEVGGWGNCRANNTSPRPRLGRGPDGSSTSCCWPIRMPIRENVRKNLCAA